jgi:hypothetical protein
LTTSEEQNCLREAQAAYERTRAAEAATVNSLIRAAFSDVSAVGRVDLRTAIWSDYDSRAVALPIEDWTDSDEHWWDIPDDVLDGFMERSSVFSFGNAASFRYYLPAYMSLGLRMKPEHGVRALSRRHVMDDGDVSKDPLSLVTDEQRVATVAFLRWVEKYENRDSVRSRAIGALLRWDAAD